MNFEDMLVMGGAAVKADGDWKFVGELCLFTTPKDPDLAEDFFSAKTDYDVEAGDRKSGYYNHGLDIKIGNRKIGRGELNVDSAAVWVQGQIKDRDEYAEAIWQMVQEGKLGLSSGSVAHLVRREPISKSSNIHHITHWPLAEWSLTPTPAEPRTLAVPLKAWAKSISLDTDEGTPAAETQVKAAVSIATVRQFEEFLRDAGYSNKQATALASHGFKGLQRDADEPENHSDTYRADVLRELARAEIVRARSLGVAI